MWNAVIVDDEPKVRKGLAQIVPWSALGFTVGALCRDGVEALEYVTAHRIDLMLTDIKMPRMNGVELMSKVRARDTSPYFIVLSGYDDYEYLKQAIRYDVFTYLLKPVPAAELRSNIEMIAGRLTERNNHNRLIDEGIDALRNTLMQRIVRREVRMQEIIAKERFLGIAGVRDWDEYHVGIARLADPTTRVIIDAEHREQQRLLETLRRNTDARNELVFVDREEHLVILAKNAKEIERIATVADRSLKYELGKQLVVFGGVRVDELLDLPKAYASAYEHLHRVFLPADSPVYLSHASAELSPTIDAYTIPTDEIDALLARGDAEGLSALLRSIMSEDLGFSRVQRNVLTTVMYMVVRMQRLFTEGRSLFDVLEVAPQDILQIATVANLQTYCDVLCARFTERVYRPTVYTGNTIVDRMIGYVRSGYQLGISLKEYAHDTGKSAAYLGQLFRETTGEKFTRYVQRVRIEHARRLLTDTTLKIKAVSHAVGFSDPRYFLAVFQQEVGCTPREFREAGGQNTGP